MEQKHGMDNLVNMQQCTEYRDSIKRRIDEINNTSQLVTIRNIVTHIAKISDTRLLISIEALARNLAD
ncbi:MAG: hypothetical protein K2I96_20925 [Lachnospiraceae bacterium]|nr:hypothetical protein [Lachnospiraceae bacterium]